MEMLILRVFPGSVHGLVHCAGQCPSVGAEGCHGFVFKSYDLITIMENLTQLAAKACFVAVSQVDKVLASFSYGPTTLAMLLRAIMV